MRSILPTDFARSLLTIAHSPVFWKRWESIRKLWRSDGLETMSAHLTELRFTSTSGLSDLIQAAIQKAAEMGYPGLFVALPSGLSIAGFLSDANAGRITIGEARIYGTGLPHGSWMISTSEI